MAKPQHCYRPDRFQTQTCPDENHAPPHQPNSTSRGAHNALSATLPVSSDPTNARFIIPALLSAHSWPREWSRPLPSPLLRTKCTSAPAEPLPPAHLEALQRSAGGRACVHISFCVIPHFPMAQMSTCFSGENHPLHHFHLWYTWRSITTQF